MSINIDLKEKTINFLEALLSLVNNSDYEASLFQALILACNSTYGDDFIRKFSVFLKSRKDIIEKRDIEQLLVLNIDPDMAAFTPLLTTIKDMWLTIGEANQTIIWQWLTSLLQLASV
jgi:hypothetical protein